MKNKIKNVCGYALYIFVTNIIYAFLLYFIVTKLLGYSKLLAYFGNLAMIILGLLTDYILVKKYYQPLKFVKVIKGMKNPRDKEINQKVVKMIFKYFVSFKTSLFFFYIFILILSQILNFYPELINEQITEFIHAIDYSVLILLGLKDFGEEFQKDREEMDGKSKEFEEAMSMKEGE